MSILPVDFFIIYLLVFLLWKECLKRFLNSFFYSLRYQCQQDQVTCKICGEKCSDIKDHACSGVLKCIHCGEAHRSNHSKCRIVKDYRAALTRTLLAKSPFQQMDIVSDASQHHFSFYSTCYTRSHFCCSFLSLIHDA
jgi:hypothetical protein